MIGTYVNDYPKGYVRGVWDPQNPSKQVVKNPVATVEVNGKELSEFIWPGHILFLDSNGNWTKNPGSTTPTLICVAQDSSRDNDVLASKLLVGLSCTDSYQLATPFFRQKSGDVYKQGTLLTYCDNTENIDGTTTTAGEGTAMGWLKPAEAGDVVIGYVDSAPPAKYAGKNNAWNLRPSFTTAMDATALVSNEFEIRWSTAYQPTVS